MVIYKCKKIEELLMSARYTQISFYSMNDLDLVEQIFEEYLSFILVNITIVQSTEYLIEHVRVLT